MVMVYTQYSMVLTPDMGLKNSLMYNQDAMCRGYLSPVGTPFPLEQYRVAIYNNGSPQPIYVMAAVKNGRSCIVYGYYNPTTERGYFEFFGVSECTQMYLKTIEVI